MPSAGTEPTQLPFPRARKRTDKRIERDGVDRWLGLSNYFSTGPAASRRGKARPVASMILDNPYLTTTGDLLIKRQDWTKNGEALPHKVGKRMKKVREGRLKVGGVKAWTEQKKKEVRAHL
ncbi:Hypothetical predicted protein [Olea europaea subsp. europaea]|uniref:Uncharacterized protein n=1 Tax=Olea europaea subsp. europaea TaxID=158383 RepID=A0A8S0UPP5_OLEEU|nr:Hypothetical predicted protein [Olea europaea subsp. europaea]